MQSEAIEVGMLSDCDAGFGRVFTADLTSPSAQEAMAKFTVEKVSFGNPEGSKGTAS